MPNCTTVVQTANDLFETEIQPNSPKKRHFSALNPTKNTHKILRHCPVKYTFFNLRNHQHLSIKVY